MKIFRFVKFLYVGLVFGSGLAADALAADIPGYPDQIEAYDSREVAMLPRYCRYTQLFRDHVPGGNDKVEIDRWYATMGPGFHAMHHYCWGLMKTHRALFLARNQQIKTFYLGSSINEFDYVLQNSPADFIMRPEILTKKGENLIRLGKAVSGVEELERAIELKADYWPPYAALSDYHKSKGDLPQARELLEKALAFAPDAKGLTNRLAELESAKVKKKPTQRIPTSDK
jgi:tetratricopeptide (TPR) repeat protein